MPAHIFVGVHVEIQRIPAHNSPQLFLLAYADVIAVRNLVLPELRTASPATAPISSGNLISGNSSAKIFQSFLGNGITH
jgi:hypothetical protein